MIKDRRTGQERTMGLLTLTDVIAETGLSRSTVFEWMRTGRFPMRIQFGARTIRWHVSDVQNWISAQMSQAV